MTRILNTSPAGPYGVAASLLLRASRPSGGDDDGFALDASRGSDCPAALACSQVSRGSSMGDSDRSVEDSSCPDSLLLSDSIVRAARWLELEDPKHSSSDPRRSTESIARAGRRGGPRSPIKKRTKLMMREVDFDPPSDDDAPGRREERGSDADVVEGLMRLHGGGVLRGSAGACYRNCVPSPRSRSPSPPATGGRGGGGRGDDEGAGEGQRDAAPRGDDGGPGTAPRELSRKETLQLRRLAGAMERTCRSRRRLMRQRGALAGTGGGRRRDDDRTAAFFSGARGALTDGLEETRRQLRRCVVRRDGMGHRGVNEERDADLSAAPRR